MKRILSLGLLTLAILGSGAVAAAACPDFVITPDGRECYLIRQSHSGACYYNCE